MQIYGAWPVLGILVNVTSDTVSLRISSLKYLCKNCKPGTSLVVQWVELCLPIQGVQVHSLRGGGQIPQGFQLNKKAKA